VNKGDWVTRWFSLHQLRTESSEEGRFERVVDGRHRGMKGWLSFTILFASMVFVAYVILMVIAHFLLY
jgi:hypothetical protein